MIPKRHRKRWLVKEEIMVYFMYITGIYLMRALGKKYIIRWDIQERPKGRYLKLFEKLFLGNKFGQVLIKLRTPCAIFQKIHLLTSRPIVINGNLISIDLNKMAITCSNWRLFFELTFADLHNIMLEAYRQNIITNKDLNNISRTIHFYRRFFLYKSDCDIAARRYDVYQEAYSLEAGRSVPYTYCQEYIHKPVPYR